MTSYSQQTSATEPLLSQWLPDDATARDSPPAYDDMEMVPLSAKDRQKDRIPSESKPYVRLCPHQTLSFEKFHHITQLKDISTAAPLELFTLQSPAHRNAAQTPTTRERLCFTAKTPGTKVTSLPIGRATISYRSHRGPSTSSPHDRGTVSGFAIHTRWQFQFLLSGKETKSKPNFAAFLRKSKVWLCPHYRIADAWIIDYIFAQLRRNECFDDPIEQYEADRHDCVNNRKCDQCDTAFWLTQEKLPGTELERCWVSATRFLGNGEDEGDSFWVEQCASMEGVLEEGEENDEEEEEEEGKREEKKRSCCILQ